MRTRRSGSVSPIDRVIPGVGRITIRVKQWSMREALDRHICRTVQAGDLEPLRLLKTRQVTPAEFLEAARSNRLLALRPMPELEPLVKRWLKTGDWRESSRVRFDQSWRLMFAALPRKATVKDLTARWWDTFSEARKESVTSATLNRDRAALLAFGGWLMAKERLSLGSICGERLEEEPAGSDILSPEQLTAVLAATPHDRRPFFWTLSETGMRMGEALNLRATDVIRVPAGLRIRVQPGSKNRRRERTVPVSADLAACLEGLAALHLDHRVFPFSRHSADRWWGDLAEALDITGVTLHGFRATFITRALDAGVPLPDVQKLVGHSTPTTTARYYRNPKESRIAAAAARAALGFREGAEEGVGVGVPAVVPATA